jgi:hypothetical protein
MLSAVGGADAHIDEAEVSALFKELSEASLYKEQLVRDVLFSDAEQFPDLMARYQQDPRTIDRGLSQVADVLEAHVPADNGQAFKGAMIGIGGEIAKASGPIFGSSVSVEEEAALVLCAGALRYQV